MRDQIWRMLIFLFKWTIVTVRVVGSYCGATFAFYAWKTGKPFLGLDEWHWGGILLVSLMLTAYARLRHSEYIFDDIDYQNNNGKEK